MRPLSEFFARNIAIVARFGIRQIDQRVHENYSEHVMGADDLIGTT